MDAKATISADEWKAKLSQEPLERSQLDRLVLNYLVVEGFKDAAEHFCRESATQNDRIDLASIDSRMQIRKAVASGHIDDAIDRVNELSIDILDANPKMYFRLQQQKLLEMLRVGCTKEALAFAQDELSCSATETDIVSDLERTMALFAFKEPPLSLKPLLEDAQRQKVASELNAAILEAQDEEIESKLPALVRLVSLAQTQLERTTNFPQIIDFTRGQLQ